VRCWSGRGSGFLQALREPAEVAQPPADPGHPCGITGQLGHEVLADRQGFAGVVADREEGQPTPGDLLIRPVLRTLGIQPQEQMQVIVHDREAGAVDGEDIDEFTESDFDPILSVGVFLSAKKCLAHAP